MAVTVYLTDPLDGDQTQLECEQATISEGLLQAEPVDSDSVVVVPMRNVAGIEGESVDSTLEQHPMQGGQYTQFVSIIT